MCEGDVLTPDGLGVGWQWKQKDGHLNEYIVQQLPAMLASYEKVTLVSLAQSKPSVALT